MLHFFFAVNIDDSEQRRRRQKMQEEQRQRNQGEGSQKPGIKRATDDYHYDKFRKQFRRY